MTPLAGFSSAFNSTSANFKRCGVKVMAEFREKLPICVRPIIGGKLSQRAAPFKEGVLVDKLPSKKRSLEMLARPTKDRLIGAALSVAAISEVPPANNCRA